MYLWWYQQQWTQQRIIMIWISPRWSCCQSGCWRQVLLLRCCGPLCVCVESAGPSWSCETRTDPHVCAEESHWVHLEGDGHHGTWTVNTQPTDASRTLEKMGCFSLSFLPCFRHAVIIPRCRDKAPVFYVPDQESPLPSPTLIPKMCEKSSTMILKYVFSNNKKKLEQFHTTSAHYCCRDLVIISQRTSPKKISPNNSVTQRCKKKKQNSETQVVFFPAHKDTVPRLLF